MKFNFDKDAGSVYYDDGDTQYFIRTEAKNHKDAWKQTSRMIRERKRPPLRVISAKEDLK